MERITVLLLTLLPLFSMRIDAQCIKDIQNIISNTTPCQFVGMIDVDNLDCFDPEYSNGYKYTWIIKSNADGSVIAIYDGIGFSHTFEKFGGYDFCLEVDKDNDPSNGPEIVECVTYTTCQICTGNKIEIEYLNCPYGFGCDIRLTTKIDAKNAIGLKPSAKFIVTYLPTPQEIAGGIEPYDLSFENIDVEFNASNDTILATQILQIPFKRGCFIPRIIFQLEEGFGAHDHYWVPCTEIALYSEEKFRCIACGNEDGECTASEVAANISNADGTCDLFTYCNDFRDLADEPLSKESKPSIKISPNPASDRLHIELPKYDCNSRKLIVFNNLGQPVIEFDLPATDTETDLYLTDLRDGLYLVAVLEYGEIAHSKQVIVSKS